MKFMNQVAKYGNVEAYNADRQKMIDEAKQLISTGKVEEGNAKMDDISELDSDYEAFGKAQANLNALAGTPAMVNMANIGQLGTQPQAGASIIDSTGKDTMTDDIYDTLEYHKAFMQNVINGTPIPAKFQNADANTKSSDVTAVIPTTTMNKIIEKMESVGGIYAKVTKTAFKGGLSIPTSAVKPVASWVAEGAKSDKQKKTTGSITFTYHKLRCAVSMSIETQTMALPAFEAAFIQNVTEAMIKAIEQGVFTGTGADNHQMVGFLTETVVDGQNVDIAKTASIKYADLCKAEAALPEEYENGAEWYMRKATFFNQIAAMVDSQGQPIARVNVGIDGKPAYTILGRTVNFTQYMPAWADTVTADTIVACIFNMADYVINTNLNMTVKKYEDNETDDQVTKAIMLVDGKTTDKNSLVTVTKKAA